MTTMNRREVLEYLLRAGAAGFLLPVEKLGELLVPRRNFVQVPDDLVLDGNIVIRVKSGERYEL